MPNAEQAQLVYIRGMIASLSEGERLRVLSAAKELRRWIVDHPDAARTAAALVSAEMAADEPMGELS
jgi:hypothetical protein